MKTMPAGCCSCCCGRRCCVFRREHLRGLLCRSPRATKFEVSFPGSVHSSPITGRVFIFVSQKGNTGTTHAAGGWGDTSPLFGSDVNGLAPGPRCRGGREAHLAIRPAAFVRFPRRLLCPGANQRLHRVPPVRRFTRFGRTWSVGGAAVQTAPRATSYTK